MLRKSVCFNYALISWLAIVVITITRNYNPHFEYNPTCLPTRYRRNNADKLSSSLIWHQLYKQFHMVYITSRIFGLLTLHSNLWTGILDSSVCKIWTFCEYSMDFQSAENRCSQNWPKAFVNRGRWRALLVDSCRKRLQVGTIPCRRVKFGMEAWMLQPMTTGWLTSAFYFTFFTKHDGAMELKDAALMEIQTVA